MILKRLGEIFFHPVFHEFLSFLFCWSCVFSLFCTDVPLRLFARLLSKLALKQILKTVLKIDGITEIRVLPPSDSTERCNSSGYVCLGLEC